MNPTVTWLTVAHAVIKIQYVLETSTLNNLLIEAISTFKLLQYNLGAYDFFTKTRNELNAINKITRINDLANVLQNPLVSSWEIAVEASTSQRNVAKVLRKQKYHQKRMQFCTCYENKCESDPQFPFKIL